MKHRYEDDLARLAFGDLEEKDAEKVRKAVDADPEASKILASYREIAEGLRCMPTPEHQLSTERLRNALLDQNLRRRTEPSFLSWLWAPVAIGACAYLFTSMFHAAPRQKASAELLPSAARVAVPSNDRAIRIEPPKAAPSVLVHANESRTPGTRPSRGHGDTRVAVKPQVHTAPASLDATTVAILSPGGRSEEPLTGFRGGNRATLTGDMIALGVENAIASNAVAMDTALAQSAPIVLIGSETDSITGASRATEVNTVSNVVVGG